MSSRSLTLACRAPFDWPALRTYLAVRSIPGVEAVAADGRYWRTLRLGDTRGWLAVGPRVASDEREAPGGEAPDGGAPDVDPSGGNRRDGTAGAVALRLEVSSGLSPAVEPLVARVRRLFDLDADPGAVDAALGRDPRLAPLVARRPGLRLPGTADRFELAVRAILGQQVTVRGASTLAGRLVRLTCEPLAPPRPGPDGGPPPGAHPPVIGEPLAVTPPGPDGRPRLTHLPLSAERLAEARPEILAGIGLPRARAATIVGLARAVADGDLPELADDRPVADPEELVRRLTDLPGIGRWTATYVAMRALPWRDAFPEGDLGLRKAMDGLTPARLRTAAEAWRPWRAYAAQHLWASLGDSTASPV